MLLNIKCPQLSKPKAKATVARHQTLGETMISLQDFIFIELYLTV